VIGGYGFAHGEPDAKKSARWCCRRNGHCGTCRECPDLALGRIAPFKLDEGYMPDKAQAKHRTNRVFKSLDKPLTYLGVERTLFYFVCVSAVGAFNLFNSILAGSAVFIGGFAFGHWVTNSDPAFLRILAKSERYLCLNEIAISSCRHVPFGTPGRRSRGLLDHDGRECGFRQVTSSSVV